MYVPVLKDYIALSPHELPYGSSSKKCIGPSTLSHTMPKQYKEDTEYRDAGTRL